MRAFLLLFLLIPTLVFSQVPQGVGYQGVAADASGISFRTLADEDVCLTSPYTGYVFLSVIEFNTD